MAEFKLQTLRRLSTAVLIHSPCQCDQIGRKFSTLAISVSLFGIWQNIKPTFVNIYAFGQILLLPIAKYLINNTAIWSHYCSLQTNC